MKRKKQLLLIIVLCIGIVAGIGVIISLLYPSTEAAAENHQDQAERQGGLGALAEAIPVPEEDSSGPGETQGQEASSEKVNADGSDPEGETAKEAEEERRSEVLVSFAGDCALGRLEVHEYALSFDQAYDKNGAAYFFQNVKDIFAADDMTIVNLEAVFTDSEYVAEREYNIRGKAEYAHILTEGCIEGVGFSNNHRNDYGGEGVNDTLKALKDEGVPAIAFESMTAVYETPDGIKIGFAAINALGGEWVIDKTGADAIKKLTEDGADIKLVYCHWGIEGEHYASETQTKMGRKLIDLGADLVIGAHPHVLQGFDFYKGKYIIYSLGNFCFGANRNPVDKNTMIVQAHFPVDESGEIGDAQLTVIPCLVSSTTERNDFCPTPAEGERYDAIISALKDYSNLYGVDITKDGIVCTIDG